MWSIAEYIINGTVIMFQSPVASAHTACEYRRETREMHGVLWVTGKFV